MTRIHEVFDWAAHTRKGLVLFIDEADAFLAKRGGLATEEARGAEGRRTCRSARLQLFSVTRCPHDLHYPRSRVRFSHLLSPQVRSALNALLYRTGSPSRHLALVLATNRPEDLDAAVSCGL